MLLSSGQPISFGVWAQHLLHLKRHHSQRTCTLTTPSTTLIYYATYISCWFSSEDILFKAFDEASVTQGSAKEHKCPLNLRCSCLSGMQMLVTSASPGTERSTDSIRLHKCNRPWCQLHGFTYLPCQWFSASLGIYSDISVFSPVTMSSTCQRARNIPTFYESTVHDCWCFTCWQGEKERES